MANNSATVFEESDGVTGFDTTIGAGLTLSGAGTSAAYIEADGSDYMPNVNTVPTVMQDMVKGDPCSFVFAWKNATTNFPNGFGFEIINTAGNIPWVRLDHLGDDLEVRTNGTVKSIPLPSPIADLGTECLLVFTLNNGTVKWAFNSRTFTTHGTNVGTENVSLNDFSLLARYNGLNPVRSGHRLYGWGFINKELSDAELADIVDYCRTNVSGLSGLPAS
jgi:hypothetical protein